MQDDFAYGQQPPRKPGLSTGAKIGIGCGVTALVLILVCGGLLYYGFQYFYDQAREYVKSFEDQGYTQQAAQVVDVTTPITTPTVFFAQVVNVRSDSHASLAFAVQVAEIHGRVDGDIDFYGQALTIHPGAVVTGDVRVKGAQVVRVMGTVQGQISGSYGLLERPTASAPPATDAGVTNDSSSPATPPDQN